MHENSLKNLVPFAKGDPRIRGGGRPKGYTPVSANMRRLLNAGIDKLNLSEDFKSLVKKFNIKNMSEFLALRTFLLTLSKNPSAALGAIDKIMDRTEGKAVQNVAVSYNKVPDVSKLTDEQLRAVLDGRADLTDYLASEADNSGDGEAEESGEQEL